MSHADVSHRRGPTDMCVFANILSLHSNFCQPVKTSYRRTAPPRCKWTITWPEHDAENKYTSYCARKLIIIHVLCILSCGVWTNLHVELHHVYHRNKWLRSSEQFVSIMSLNGKFPTSKLMYLDIPCFDVEYICGFVWWGSASKVDDVTALPSDRRWRIFVTMVTLWQQQDGGYMLLWKRYVNNKMAAMCFLHLQQYSHRLNLLYVFI